MDKLKEQIWLGNCDCNCSGVQIAYLYHLVGEAVQLISGMQQPSRPCDDVNVEQFRIEHEADNRRLKEMAGEIYLRLTGQYVGKVHKTESEDEEEENANQFSVGDWVMYKGQEMEVVKVSKKDGTLTLEYGRNRIARGVDPSKCVLADDDDSDEEQKDRYVIMCRDVESDDLRFFNDNEDDPNPSWSFSPEDASIYDNELDAQMTTANRYRLKKASVPMVYPLSIARQMWEEENESDDE